MKTLKDIAKLAGVSPMTISRYFSAPNKLSKATRDKVKALVEEYNYSPNVLAKSLITKKSGFIGVIVPDIRNPFFSQLYYELESCLEPMGYSLMLCNSKENAQKEYELIQLLISRQVEGFIIIPVDEENVELLIKRKINFVLVERILESSQANSVSSDHYQGAYLAVEYLLQSGHKNIAILCGDTDIKPYYDRLKAYTDALTSYGIPLNKQLICESKIDIESAKRAFLNLINSNEIITAVFSCNNLMSLGAINAIYQSNLTIPDDISFAAFDELPRTEFLIQSLTCVIQDTGKLAESAVRLLLKQISNVVSPPEHLEVPVILRKGI
jgi:LacI family transcriptional regulator